jgi:hypothetical protein
MRRPQQSAVNTLGVTFVPGMHFLFEEVSNSRLARLALGMDTGADSSIMLFRLFLDARPSP